MSRTLNNWGPPPAHEQFLHWMEHTREASPETIRSYRRTLTAFFSTHTLGVDAGEIERWLTRPKRDGAPRTPATKRLELSALRSFYRWAQGRGIHQSNPAWGAGTPKVHGRDPQPLDRRTWLRIWQAELTVEDRVWLGFGAFGGLRRAEIAALRVGHADVDARRIVGFVRKGGGTDTLPYGIGFDALQAPAVIERLLVGLVRGRDADEHLFPILEGNPNQVNYRLARIARRVGVEARPHQLRHTCATGLVRAGWPLEAVADYLDHANLQTTRRYVDALTLLERMRPTPAL